MTLIITNIEKNEDEIELLGNTIKWKNHKELLLQLVKICDECLLVSPFLAKDFNKLLDGISLKGKSIELISTCAPRGDDQFSKPFSLRDFGNLVKSQTGDWPVIGLDQKLHSKVYIFRKNGTPFAGIVTSANFTESGLALNNETGVLIQEEKALLELEETSRAELDYVNLADWQLDKLCQNAEISGSVTPPSGNREIGLSTLLNNYATPSAGNRTTKLRPEANYFIKVSGVRDRPILPEQRIVIDKPQSRLTFAKEPKGLKLGDCLLEVAVGGACFLSYYACASAIWEFTAEEQNKNKDYQRWPYYVFANNLSLNYGTAWFESPIYYDQLVADFKSEHPNTAVTKAGKDHFKGAIQMGHSYVRVTKEFGDFVKARIDSYRQGISKDFALDARNM